MLKENGAKYSFHKKELHRMNSITSTLVFHYDELKIAKLAGSFVSKGEKAMSLHQGGA